MAIGAAWLVSIVSGLLVGAGGLYSLSTPPRMEIRGVGEVFTDCENCPEMLPIHGGRFHMGRQLRRREVLLSRLGIRRFPELRTVDVAPFAIGRTEVTFAQWDACVAASGCRGYHPSDRGWGRDARPVIHVSWSDAQDYVNFLSHKTKQHYRLPSEAEWEFAARAGTTTPFSWGRRPDRSFANFGKETCPPCLGEIGGRDVWEYTAPVAQFPPNAFGLHDMHGNVYEWTQDCFAGLPTGNASSAPVITEDCERRSIRGGGWHNDPRRIQSDYRGHLPPGLRGDNLGFRVARGL
jgi:formylglycine-generating enzyme required for sulfatase activity